MLEIRNASLSDAAAIEAVVVAAFRDAPHTSHTEHIIVRELQKGDKLAVSLVAEDDSDVIGHVAISPVAISDGAADWYGLGPVAVLPERQNQSIGTLLIQRALEDLRALGAAGCVVLGEPGYYARFGFNAEPSLVLPGVPAEYFQAVSFDGSMPSGQVSYDDAFGAAA